MRVPIIGGNWKSFNDYQKVGALIKDLSGMTFASDVDVVVAPTFLYLGQALNGLKNVAVAAQNCSATSDGAFTGEISAAGLHTFGVQTVILGHSERRSLFGETNDVVATKVAAALNAGMRVIACIGETLGERQGNTFEAVLSAQMMSIKAGVEASASKSYENVVIAYEPVWAIGTGVVATPIQAQDTQKFVRGWIAQNISSNVAESVRIMYGGSVKPNNAKELISQPDIDGFLVGGASLVATDFHAIVSACSKSA